MILVGNIKDLNGERKVSFDEAATFAHSKKMEYMEISTYNNYNCVKPFRILLKEILLCEKKLDDYFNYKNNIKKASMELMEKEKVNDNDEEVKFKLLNI